jgi:hypothetical protein
MPIYIFDDVTCIKLKVSIFMGIYTLSLIHSRLQDVRGFGIAAYPYGNQFKRSIFLAGEEPITREIAMN